MGVTGPVDTWLPQFMEEVGRCSQVPLSRVGESQGMSWHQWQALQTFEGQWAGKVLVQLKDRTEVERVQGALQGKEVQIQDHSAAIGITSDFINLGLYH